MKLKFLGTGGGRFAMIKQLRQTGGFILSSENFKMHVDPGPGALVHGLENDLDFEELDCVFCSHGHTDHCGDLEVVLEAVTGGCKKDTGTLIAPGSVLGSETEEPVLGEYYLDCPKRRVLAEDGITLNIEGGTLQFFETDHKDVSTAGFRLETEESSFAYVPDTEIFEGLIEKIGSTDYLVLNVVRPYNKSWKGHMNLKDAVEIVRELDPDRAFFQHFGINFIYSFGDQKKWLEENYEGDNIVLASDNKTYSLDGEDRLERFVD